MIDAPIEARYSVDEMFNGTESKMERSKRGRVKVLSWGVALTATVLSAMSLPGGASTLSASPLMTGSTNLTLQSQSVVASGIVKTSWTFPGGSVAVVDMAGSSVSAGCTGQPGSQGSCWSSTGPTSPSAIARYYSQTQAAQLTYSELRALGASSTVAQSMAQSTLPPGTAFSPSASPHRYTLPTKIQVLKTEPQNSRVYVRWTVGQGDSQEFRFRPVGTTSFTLYMSCDGPGGVKFTHIMGLGPCDRPISVWQTTDPKLSEITFAVVASAQTHWEFQVSSGKPLNPIFLPR